MSTLLKWYITLVIFFGIIASACYLPIGDCQELEFSSNVTGIGSHLLDLQNNSSRVEYNLGNSSAVIIRCNNTGLWEVTFK